MTQPITLGLIGAGIWARRAYVPNLLAMPDDFRVRAVYSRTLDNARQLAGELPGHVHATADLDAILGDADIAAVAIAVPIDRLPAITELALQAGKHVLSEKPVATDLATGRRLLAEYAGCPGQVWAIGEQWRYEEAAVTAAAAVQHGEIGVPILAQWAVFNRFAAGNPYYTTAWRRQPAFRGGIMLDGLIHRMAALRDILGEVIAVNAVMRQERDDFPTPDTLSAHLEFATGALGSLSATYSAGFHVRQPLTITGTEGTLQLDGQFLDIYYRDGRKRSADIVPNQAVAHQFADFAAAIRGAHPVRSTPLEAVRDVAAMLALFDSAAAGSTVHVEAVQDSAA